jgi:hypothetical protein
MFIWTFLRSVSGGKTSWITLYSSNKYLIPQTDNNVYTSISHVDDFVSYL